MNGSELPWPTGLLRPSWYAPAPKSAGSVRSNCSASAFPSPPGGEGGVRGLGFGLATRLPTIFGLEHVSSLAPSSCLPSKVTRTVRPRSDQFGVILVIAGGLGFSGKG